MPGSDCPYFPSRWKTLLDPVSLLVLRSEIYFLLLYIYPRDMKLVAQFQAQKCKGSGSHVTPAKDGPFSDTLISTYKANASIVGWSPNRITIRAHYLHTNPSKL